MSHHERMKERISERLASISDLKLTLEVDVPGAKVYRLGRPDTNIMSTTIAFVARRIFITGDHSPGFNGAISDAGYGESWLAGSGASYSYLASKFLRDGYHAELAEEPIRERLDELRGCRGDGTRVDNGVEVEEATDLLEEVLREGCEADVVGRYGDVLARIFDYDIPGHGYHPGDVVTLSAIAQRFGQLRSGAKAPPPEPQPAAPADEEVRVHTLPDDPPPDRQVRIVTSEGSKVADAWDTGVPGLIVVREAGCNLLSLTHEGSGLSVSGMWLETLRMPVRQLIALAAQAGPVLDWSFSVDDLPDWSGWIAAVEAILDRPAREDAA